jgi:NADPH:quinone reductase-like Zn-dependent oxidoreductase
MAAAATTHPGRAQEEGAGPRAFRAYEIGAQRGIASLRLAARTASEPSGDEVLIRPWAAALNHRDLSISLGRYGGPKPDSRIPVGDGAGEVLAVGEKVSDIRPGDRVTAAHFSEWLDGQYPRAALRTDIGNSMDGWLAGLITLRAHSLVKLPDDMSYADAAALGAAGITAWEVLENLGQIKAGDVVLTLGTGGVSTLALQIAKMNGAQVAITSSSDDKLALAKRLGADITVNYREQPEWDKAVKAATGGKGADIVLETVGLTTLSQSLRACAPHARVGFLGALGGRSDEQIQLGPLLLGNLVLRGITSGSRKTLVDLLRASAANGLQPYIDRTFSFGEAPAAYEYLQAAGHVGKVVIDLADA